MSEARVRGFVKQYDELEGTGLIDIDDRSEDAFVYVDDVRTDSPAPKLRRGERVEFRVEENEKGFQARNVERVPAEVGEELTPPWDLDETEG
jgi:cold shock CspA family protein